MSMTCKHRPISNGWSGGPGCSVPPTTWCGYCKRNVLVDEAWAEKYYEAQRQRAMRQMQTGWAGPDALEAIETAKRRLIQAIREHSGVAA